MPPVLFNPYTGEPRDARDIASDPHGVLIVPPGAMLAAAPQAPAAPVDIDSAEAYAFASTNEPTALLRHWFRKGFAAGQAAPAAPAVDVLSPERMREEFIAWAEVAYRHEKDFTKRDFEICLKAWRFGSANALLAAQAATNTKTGDKS
ncbi:hypothetical protein BI380_32455 [Delftia tsuruhatensis]|uniref:Uncharacterized protein n=1 Tax=Delftia tsuruhatensis TaxID=180282 RepID=A0ABM6EDU9_9BURK|nr:hypothetical protein BI380_32455 [Delftia tsuruhatensis]